MLLCLAGCMKIAEVNTELDMNKGDVRRVSFDALPYDYELNVEFRSTNSIVTVAIFNKADVLKLKEVDSKKALATHTAREGKLVQKIDKGTAVSVVILNDEMKTDVWTKVWSK